MNSKESSEKRINPVTGKEVDPMFEGHLEKRIRDMTPKEKLIYLWDMMQFKYEIGRSIRIKENDSKHPTG